MLKKFYKPIDLKETLSYNVPKAKIYFSTYYLGDLSKQMANYLKEIVGHSFSQIKLLIIFKIHSTVGDHLQGRKKRGIWEPSSE